MSPESLTWSHSVFIHDTQRPKFHVVAILVGRERKRVVRIEPAVIGVTSILRSANLNHDCTSL